jgi:hypothetical protein
MHRIVGSMYNLPTGCKLNISIEVLKVSSLEVIILPSVTLSYDVMLLISLIFDMKKKDPTLSAID